VRLTHFDSVAVGTKYLNVQAQRLHFLDEHLERFRNTWLWNVLALDDSFVDLHAAVDIIRLDGQDFLQRVSGTVCFQCPNFHFTEALATELGLTTQWLLRDHGVWTGGAGVDLVVHQVVQLQDVHVAHGYWIRQWITGAAVEQLRLAGVANQANTVTGLVGRIQDSADFLFRGTVEDRGGHSGGTGLAWQVRQIADPFRLAFNGPTLLGSPTQVDFHNLTDVHAAWNTQRVQDDIQRSAVFQEWHVFQRHDARDDTLVTVTACKLVTNGDLALLCHVNADQLVHAWGQVIVVVAVEDANTNDGAGLAVRNLQGSIANFAGLLTENGTQQTLFRGQLGLALRGDTAYQYVAGFNFSTDVDDAAVIKLGED